MTPTGPTALVVVPTYNERDNLPLLVDGLMRHANVRLLVVDDQSPDGTGQLAETLAREHQGRINVLHRTANRGLGRSYIDGIKIAIREPVDVICQMDADLSHDPAALPELLRALDLAGAIVTIDAAGLTDVLVPASRNSIVNDRASKKPRAAEHE